MTVIKDDRTPEQKKTHDWVVVGTDSFMSGWASECSTGRSISPTPIIVHVCEERVL